MRNVIAVQCVFVCEASRGGCICLVKSLHDGWIWPPEVMIMKFELVGIIDTLIGQRLLYVLRTSAYASTTYFVGGRP